MDTQKKHSVKNTRSQFTLGNIISFHFNIKQARKQEIYEAQSLIDLSHVATQCTHATQQRAHVRHCTILQSSSDTGKSTKVRRV